MEAIHVAHLTKIYPNGKAALQDMSMVVQKGEIFTLLGQNGAGKSTLINILTTYLAPTQGKVNIMGYDLETASAEIRKHIACVAQRISIDHHLTLIENLMFQCRLYRLDTKEASHKVDELIQTFGLNEYTDRRVATYSGGIKRRLDIAMGMVSNPGILFLDEPSVGLDVEARQAVWQLIHKVRHDFDTTVLLTTHDLEEASILSDTVCIMKEGHELVQDSPANLRSLMQQDLVHIDLKTTDHIQLLADRLLSEPFVTSLHRQNHSLSVAVTERDRDLVTINRLLLEKEIPYRSLGFSEPRLENVYLSLVQTQGKGE